MAVVVVLWMAALSICDIRLGRLPNALTLPGAGAVLLAAAFANRGPAALAGAAALSGMYLAVHLLSSAAMGAGDVKLAIGLGGLTGGYGAGVWFLAALTAPLLTVLVATVRGVRAVPHGPSMCLATAVAVGLAVW